MPDDSNTADEADAPHFTLALRRNPGTPANWRLRFEVSGGAFILRSRRAGVDVDGPPLAGGAVDIGPEDILGSLRLRLVDYSGQRLSTYRISQHHATQPGRWAPLQSAGADEDGTVRLLPPDVEDEPPGAQTTDARAVLRNESPAPARIVKHLRRELGRSRIEAETLATRVAELELRLASAEDIDGDPTDSP
jgi:hypothetical protein